MAREDLSPCISVCSVNEATGYCYGCFRNLQEITDWKRYTNDERKQVLAQLDDRKAQSKDDRHPYA